MKQLINTEEVVEENMWEIKKAHQLISGTGHYDSDFYGKVENLLTTILTAANKSHEEALAAALLQINKDVEDGKLIGLQYLSTYADMLGVCKAQEFINKALTKQL